MPWSISIFLPLPYTSSPGILPTVTTGMYCTKTTVKYSAEKAEYIIVIYKKYENLQHTY